MVANILPFDLKPAEIEKLLEENYWKISKPIILRNRIFHNAYYNLFNIKIQIVKRITPK